MIKLSTPAVMALPASRARLPWLMTGVVATALVLSATLPSFAADKPTAPPPPASAPMGAGPGWHHGGQGGPGGMHHPGFESPFSGPRFERLLTELKATDAQRAQIKQITTKAQADLKTLHEQGRELHAHAMDFWTQPKLDAAEAEKQRQKVIAHHDQVSKRMTQLALDVGQVLTPEQRAQAAQILKDRREHMREGFKERMKDRMGERHHRQPPAPAQ